MSVPSQLLRTLLSALCTLLAVLSRYSAQLLALHVTLYSVLCTLLSALCALLSLHTAQLLAHSGSWTLVRVTGVLTVVSWTGACDSVQPNGFAWQISQSKPQPPHWRLFAATHPQLSGGSPTTTPCCVYLTLFPLCLCRTIALVLWLCRTISLVLWLSHTISLVLCVCHLSCVTLPPRVIPQYYLPCYPTALHPYSPSHITPRLTLPPAGGLAAITIPTTSQSLEQLNQKGALPTRSGYNSSLPTREYENMRI